MKTKCLHQNLLMLKTIICIGIFCVYFVVEARTLQSKSGTDSSTFYAKSYALVIGVNEPQGEWSPLSSAQADAKLFASHLKKRGFDVTLLLGNDANKQEILKQLQTNLPKKVKAGDRFIFYFAGHGQTQTLGQGKKLGYIVPADGTKDSSQDEWHTYLSMRELRSLLTEHILSKHTLLIFDSCFSGLMFTRGGLRRPNLDARSYLRKSGVMAITAGGEGELAVDGLFTPTFIQALSGDADENGDGITSFQEVALYTRREVRTKQEQQNPQFGVISGTGQMIFKSQDSLSNLSIVSQNKDQSAAQKLDRELAKVDLIDPSSLNRTIIWSSTAVTSGLVLLAGAGLMVYARDQFTKLQRELNNEPNDIIHNQRLETEGQVYVNQNNGAIALLAFGGSGLLFSIYQLLSPFTHATLAPAKNNSNTITFLPDPINKSVGFEITW